MKAILEEPFSVFCVAMAIMIGAAICAAAWADSNRLSSLELQAYQAFLEVVGMTFRIAIMSSLR